MRCWPDHLDRGTEDHVVARFCGEKKWSLITFDEMRYTDETKKALVAGRVKLFKVVTHDETHYMQIVSAMVIAQRRMLEIVHKNSHACCSHIYTNGDVSIVSRFADIPPGLTPKQQKTFLKYGRV